MTPRLGKHSLMIVLLGMCSCFAEEGKRLGNADTYTRIFNGGYNETAQDIIETDDGGLMILGITEIAGVAAAPPHYKIKLIKTTRYGHTQWEKSYPPYAADKERTLSYRGRSIIKEARRNGGTSYLIVGDSIQNRSQSSLWLMRIDEQGNIIDSFGMADHDDTGLEGVAITANEGGCIVLGSIVNSPTPNDMILIGLNAALQFQWSQAYGSGSTTLIHRLISTDAPPALLWGGSVVRAAVSAIRFIKAPPNSQSAEFDLPLGTPGINESGSDLCKYGEGFAFAGTTIREGSQDMLLMRVDAEGKEIFSAAYGSPNYAEGGSAITVAQDGGLVLLGFTENPGITRGEKDFYLVKANLLGEKQWERTLGSRNNDVGVRVLSVGDGGFVILGTTSFGGLFSMVLIKTDRNGYVH